MDHYSKYKERTPEETILFAQKILQEAGMFPVLKWTGESRDGLFSTRITLYPTSAGVNGKGTDERYSTASGYGELMERLQNNVLLPRFRSGPLGEIPFTDSPDEMTVPVEDVLKDPDPFTRNVLSALSAEDEWSDGEAACRIYGHEENGTEVMTVVPFTDVASNRIVNVPISLLRRCNGSNGMAAGNTMEEAIVQGLSELLEREINLMALKGEIVPPEIPDDAIKDYDFYPVVQRLRENKRYRVRFLDFSLGRGWPVAALCINDLETGTFGLRFGAHPSFPVALERTLTEAAQGEKITAFATRNSIGNPDDVTCNANRSNVFTVGAGLYPAELFHGTPGWTFKPWTRFQGKGNRSFLREMLGLLKEEGMTIMVRDTSFLGFPACFIVVPQLHTLEEMNGTVIRLRRTLLKAADSWDHFPDLSEPEIRRILLLLKYFKNDKDHKLINDFTGAMLESSAYSNDRIGAILSLKLEDFEQAEEYLSKAAAMETDPQEHKYLVILKQYAVLCKNGLDHRDAHEVIRNLFAETDVKRVIEDTEDFSKVMEKCLPPLSCPDCASCRWSGKECRKEELRALYAKLVRAMKKENVSQEALLELLKELW